MNQPRFVLFSLIAFVLLLSLSPVQSQEKGALSNQQFTSQPEKELLRPSAATGQAVTDLIAKARTEGSARVIVGVRAAFHPEGRLTQPAAVRAQRNAIAQAQTALLNRLSTARVTSIKRFAYIPFVAMEVDAATLETLRNLPEVTAIEEDAFQHATLAESVPLIGAPAAWAAGFSGAGQAVAILDTGVDKTHPFLTGKVVSEACYSTTGSATTSVCPGGAAQSTATGSGVNCSVAGCEHGTHVAGIAAGKSATFSGVARDANVVAIQVFSRVNGCTSTVDCTGAFNSDIILGLQRVQALGSSINIAAANLSLGGGGFNENCDATQTAFKAAIDNLRSIGIATTVASGNDGNPNGLSSPACLSSAISVGSTGDGSGGSTVDAVSSFSNSGTFLNLLAPGEYINSSVPGGSFSVFRGTSMAAPHVAGAWAVLKSKSPTATVPQVLAALASTGKPITDARNGVTKPRIKVDAAVSALATGSCSFSLSPATQSFTVSGGTGTVNVTASAGCAWTAASNDSWLTITSGSSGTGNGTVNYSVAGNTSLPRSGTLFIAGQTFIAPQAGVPALSVDDGSQENALGLASGGTFTAINRLTPASYPATINAVAIYFPAGLGVSTGNSVTILAGKNPSGSSSISSPSFDVSMLTSVQAIGKFNIYSIPSVTITSGDFLVGMRITHSSGVLPAAIDIGPPLQRRSYVSTNGTSFTIIDDINSSLAGNFMMRAILDLRPIITTVQPATITAESCGTANHAIDPGETVTVNLPLKNIGSNPTSNLVATLQPGGGVTAPSSPQNYGALASGAATVSRPFSFTADPALTCGSTLMATLQLQDGATSLGTASFTFTVGPGSINNYSYAGASVAIPDVTTVEIPITVPDTGIVRDVNVRVRLNHSFDGDLVISLVGPDGTTVELSNRNGSSGDNYGGGANDCTGDFTIFDDQAATAITSGGAPFTGMFKPQGQLSVFNGQLASGIWKLRVNDVASGDSGTLGCWQLDLARQSLPCCSSTCPFIAAASTTTGPVGTGVVLTGVNLAGVTGVRFANNLAANFTINSDTQITATVPAGAITGPLTISKSGCPDFQINFTVITCPTVSGLTPTGGVTGTTVTIIGANLTGVTMVTFSNNATASFTVNSNTQIVATVPSNAVSGPIAISKPGCTDVTTASFTVCPAITLSPTSLPAGTVNTAYSQTLTASGGTAPYSFTVSSGTLPGGLTLNSGGVLSGTPSVAGTFSFTVTATAANGCVGTRSYTVTIGAILDPQSRVLYVLNDNPSGNQIYAFAANETTGVLALLAGFPISTGGTGSGLQISNHLAIDRTNQRLYIINDGSDTVNAYTINPATGSLTAMPFSPISLGSGTWDSIAVHPSGSPMVVGDSGGRLLSYQVTATIATAAAGSPYNTGSARSFSSAFSQDGNYVYTGGDINTTIAGFGVNATTGVLSALPGSPFDSGNTAPTAYATDSAGRLFVTNEISGQVRVFTTAGGIPSAVSGNPFTSGLGSGIHALLHPNGFYLVADRNSNRVGVYRISGSGNGTTLTSVTGSPFVAGGSSTNVLALNQAGTFLFAANGLSRNLTTFSVNVATGALTALATQPSSTLGNSGGLTGMAYLSTPCPIISLSPAILPNGTVGTAYNQIISASPAGNYTFAVTAGTLPAGLSLSPSGLLSGTPTQGGNSTITIRATDANSCTATASYTLAINCPAITLSPASLPAGAFGAAYNQTVMASGGKTPYSFALSAGALPNGLTLSSSGVLSGAPTQSGSFNFTVRATDAGNCTGTQVYTLVINCPTITLSPSTLPAGTLGVAYSQTVTASPPLASGSYSFTIIAGALPAGLSLNAATGAITGTPTTAGTTSFTLTASSPGGSPSSAGGCAGSQAYSINIQANGCQTVASFSPMNGLAGTSVTINGGGFTGVTAVKFSNNLTAQFTIVSAAQITTTAPVGTATGPITISKTGCTDVQTTTFIAGNAVPMITSLMPDAVAVDGPGFLLTVKGTGFATNAQARWNGSGRGTTVKSATELQMNIFGSDIAAEGINVITVFNPAPGGGLSNEFNLPVGPAVPIPVLNGIAPASAAAGGPGFTLTVTGSNFVNGSVVKWNNAIRPTSFSSGTQLTATISATDIATAGTASITVFNPGPGGGTSAERSFTITASCPTVSSISPTSGAAGNLVIVTGTNLGNVTAVKFANNLTANFAILSDTQIAAYVPENAVTGTITISKQGCPDRQTGIFTIIPLTCLTPPPGLVAWLPGDGNANDLAGTNHGTLKNGATATGTGKVSQAFSLDGMDDYVEIPNAPALSPANLTVDAWVKSDSFNKGIYGAMHLVSKGYDRTRGSYSLLLSNTDAPSSNVRYACFQLILNEGDISNIVCQPAPNIREGIFYHLAGTWDGTNAKLYVNGVLEAQSAYPGQSLGSNTLPLNLGKHAYPGGVDYQYQFPGIIDEVEIFNRALTAAEVQAIFNAGSMGKCKPSIPCPVITSISPTSGLAGATVRLTGTNLTGITGVKFAGGAPAQFTVNSDTQITATVPATAITGPITISKTGCQDVQTVGFTVCATLTITPASLPDIPGGVAYSQPLTTTGGTAPYSFAVTAGALPNGLALSSSGVLSGTPNVAGTFNFTVTATDANGCTGTRSYTLNITVTLGAQTRALYVLNDKTSGNQIYGYAVNETTGTLTRLAGFPISTGGNGDISDLASERLTIDRANQRLYAINASSSTISAYVINPTTGALTPLPFSPINLGNGVWRTVAVHPSGSPLVIGDGNSSRLVSYQITATTAVAAAGSPYNTGSAIPASTVFSQDGNYVYTGGNVSSTIAGFSVNAANGVLTALAGSPVDSGNPLPRAYATDVMGRLFIANSIHGQVRVFTTASGIPSATSGNPFVSGVDQANHGLMHPNGFYLVVGRNNNVVGVYRISGSGSVTTLTAVTASPFAVEGSIPTVLTLNQSGTFLFVANDNSHNLTTFSVNPTTGVLSTLNTQPANTLGSSLGAGLTGMAYFAPPCPTISLSPTTLPGGTVGTAYNQAVTASPAVTVGNYNFSVTAGALPTGLSLNSSTGAITGTPTTAGTASFTITALSFGPCSGSQAYSITVQPACPTVAGINPASGMAGAQVTITGTNLTGVTAVKFAASVAAQFTVVSDTQITTIVPNGAITGPITISKTGCEDVQTGVFTVTPPVNNRIVRVVNASGAAGGTVSVPVELVAQGNENALGFSLSFDPAILSSPQTALGSDAAGASLNTNASQAAQGRLGIVLSLPAGQQFGPGVRQILVVTFTIAANAAPGTTTVGFGDQPVPREVVDAIANPLSTIFTAGVVTITPGGYEADVSPRPDGNNNGTVTLADYVQVGRFVAGLDTPATGSEFQRADCAPRQADDGTLPLGNGVISLADYVQAGRYAVGLDPVVRAGGPTGPPSTAQALARLVQTSSAGRSAALDARRVRALNGDLESGRSNTLSIELEATGQENALAFSLHFDAERWRILAINAGRDATRARLQTNLRQQDSGRMGLTLVLPPGETLAAGRREIVMILFAPLVTAQTAPVALGFSDEPVAREVVDTSANTLPASFTTETASPAIGALTNVSAASLGGTELAPGAIATAFGSHLATAAQSAAESPLPASLSGTLVKVTDGAGIERQASLFFVSPNQVNYQVPPDTATGRATVTITSGDGAISTGAAEIAESAFGLFAANADGQGVAAAVALRVRAGGTQQFEPVAVFNAALNRFVAAPIDVGVDGEEVYLIVYGTGLRAHGDSAQVTAAIGGVRVEVLYAGAQSEFAGLDQINLRLPRELAGRGDVTIQLQVGDKLANPITIKIK